MSTQVDNAMRWDGEPGAYEVWYLTFNQRRTGAGFWIRYTLHAPKRGRGEPTCRLWFAFFDANHPRNNVAVNHEAPISRLNSSDAPFRLEIDGAELRHGGARGEIRRPDGSHVRWDLSFRPGSFTHRHLPESFYSPRVPVPKLLSPSLLVHMRGVVEVGNRRFELEDEPGCQAHMWGQRHADQWAWTHCSTFREDPTALLEGFSARLKTVPLLTTPALTALSLYFGGEVYHFNELYTLPLTRGRWKDGQLTLSARGPRVRIEAEVRSRPEDMVRAEYRDPGGGSAHCHNTGVADAVVTLYSRRSPLGSFRQVARLTSRASAHFEFGAREPDERVKRRHEAV